MHIQHRLRDIPGLTKIRPILSVSRRPIRRQFTPTTRTDFPLRPKHAPQQRAVLLAQQKQPGTRWPAQIPIYTDPLSWPHTSPQNLGARAVYVRTRRERKVFPRERSPCYVVKESHRPGTSQLMNSRKNDQVKTRAINFRVPESVWQAAAERATLAGKGVNE